MKRMQWVLLVGLFAVGICVQADTYYLAEGQPTGHNWDTLTDWFSSSDGTGTNPAGILSTDDFDINGFALRSPTSANPVFTGNSLTISGDAGFLMKQGSTATITNLISQGGNIIVGNASVTQELHVVNLTINGYTRLDAGAIDKGIALTVDYLVGSQGLKLGATSSDIGLYTLNIADASGFDGTLQSVFGTTDFENDVDMSSATYQIFTNAGTSVILDQDITVETLIIGDDTLTPGTYSFEELNAAYDDQFVDGGTGSITVTHETYFLNATQTTGKSWISYGFWTNSLGENPASIDVGDEYFSNGFTLRSPSGGGSFDANLTMSSVLAFVSPDTFTIQKLTTLGGTKIFGFSGTVTVHVVEFDAAEYFRTYSDAGKGLDFQIDTLTGGATWTDADNTSDLGYRGISVTDALAYTGEVKVVWGVTDFNNDLDMRNGSLYISTAGAGSVILDQDIIVGSLVIGDETYAPGTYSFDDLNTAYDAKFVDGGTGSIQVGFSEASFAGWIEDFPSLSGPDAELLADPDGDGLNNLMEYAMGGTPTNSDSAAVSPAAFVGESEGTNWFYYVYRRRLDAVDRGLEYAVLSGDDLVSDSITNLTEEAGTAAIDSEFEMVSNRVETVAAECFIKLDISLSQ